MRQILKKILIVVAAMLFFVSIPTNVFAEDDSIAAPATSISISPVSKILQLEPNKVYEDILNVTNNGETEMEFETYASPYSYTRENEDSAYQLGFSKETAYTQITRWITFRDPYGNYSTNARYVAEPGQTVGVKYRIITPDSIPTGGQYAVLFAHTLSSASGSGIRTEANPGMIIYGHSDGETISASEFSDLAINQTLTTDNNTKNQINASANVKNTGNIDFMASGILKVEGIFGHSYYETPANKARISVIPEVELEVSDAWKETPFFGLFKVYWTVTAGDHTETISSIIFIFPPAMIIVVLLLLTIITIWIIIVVRKRKERRARFAV